MANYFEEQEIGTVERVILAESIVLPEVSNYPLTLQNLEKHGGEYKLAEREYKDTKGKFYIKIMSPTMDTNGKATSQNKTSVSTYKHSGASLNTKNYSSTNYLTLTIPKYILLNFKGTIPKGTEFIMASIGGSTRVEYMKIIGVIV